MSAREFRDGDAGYLAWLAAYRRPPAEAEAEYYAHLQVGQHTDHT